MRPGEPRYGEETIQPDPDFIPQIAWAKDGKSFTEFEHYYLKERVTSPGSRIIYKGTKVERLKFYPYLIKYDNFSWLGGYKYSHNIVNFTAFLAVTLDRKHWESVTMVTEFIAASKDDLVLLPRDIAMALKPIVYKEFTEKINYFKTPFQIYEITRTHLYFVDGLIAPSMPEHPEYIAHSIMPEHKPRYDAIKNVRIIIPVHYTNEGLLVSKDSGGILTYSMRFSKYGRSDHENNTTILFPNGKGGTIGITDWYSMIYKRDEDAVYIVFPNTFKACHPFASCERR